MVLNREKTSADLSGVLASHADEAAAMFADMVQLDLDEDRGVPDLSEFQRLLSRRLERLRKELVRADEIHRTERIEDQQLRIRRDEAAAELSRLLSAIRVGLEGPCGAESSKDLLGLEGSVPRRDPVALRRLATRTVERLRSGRFQLPASALPGFSFDPAAWIPLLEEPLDRLETALEGLSREKSTTTGKQLDKSDLIAEYDRAYSATARLLENFFRYIGKTGLAQRVRPSRHSGADVEEEPLESLVPQAEPPGVEVSPPDP